MLLAALTMVDVKVEYQDLLKAMDLLRVLRHDRDVVKDAKAHRPSRDRVVSCSVADRCKMAPSIRGDQR